MGMKKIYHLANCTTCQRILKELAPLDGVTLQEIKTDPLTEIQLQELHTFSGSYEALFSKRAMLYRQKGLNEQELEERDFKHWLLQHYTFLKRPVILVGDEIFIGNAKKNIEAAKTALHS